jgi:5'-3' exonuclease
LRKLQNDYNERKIKGTKQLYRRLKSVYRAPPDAAKQVLDALKKLGWTICCCPHQADCCIARNVQHAARPQDVRIITKDSDLLVYEATTSITLPVGNQWKTFQKKDLLDRYQLPTPAHLLLLGILTANDYTNGVPFYGLVSNAEIVRGFVLDGLVGLNNQAQLQQLKLHIQQYLDIVHNNARQVQDATERILLNMAKKDPQNKTAKKRLMKIEKSESQLDVTSGWFDHALQAFVMCTERPLPTDGSTTASTPPDTHSIVKSFITNAEMKKAQANWERFSRTQTSSTRASAPAPISQVQPPYKMDNKDKKRERRHGSRARSRRRQKWLNSRYAFFISVLFHVK